MSAKKETQDLQDLKGLEGTYRIVGELSARDNIRSYLATRVEDAGDVLILIEDSPEGDAGNALTHFAADANLLASLEHRNLIPIHEGRWLGENRFAVVTDRCAAPTLATLIGRNETWSYPRIATILHEVNGLLEWARRQKVVHRTLTLDTIHLEPDTDRVLVSFVAQPLTRQGPPGADGDARTIASLAWTLITRGRALPGSVEDSIGVVRPELPRRVVEATDALLHRQRVGETDPPAVLDYIALVATTDVLMEGEVAVAEVEAVVLQEQVLEREAFAAREREYNERMEEQERRMREEREEMERTLLREREELTETLATEREQVAEERRKLEEQFAAQREEMEQAMQRGREEMERTLQREREEMERTLQREREEMERTLLSEREELTETLATEREKMARERAALEEEVAAERQQLARERTELEERLAAERASLAASLTDGERSLADARAEMEAAMKAQREEFERALAAERAEFDATLTAERNAFEAEKEGLEVFHRAEREQIEAERRALEELYLAYEAEGHVVEHVHDDRSGNDESGGDPSQRGRSGAIPGLLSSMAPAAVAQPVTEPEPDAGNAENTAAGKARRRAPR